ncbi:MAG: hypothetical protein COC19_03045 [SAR86 cluster bacterium]|uniref:DUF2523 domain-containing protein n=1 Tax=SAR86 cluster bacterium TaxID=2030880 RepID=A0A2A4MRJ8_9GAMM|nr:MAG: hypothetical protein COC19_03045 [SAR86 cluster bacterium]
MILLLRLFAYFCLITTPFQVALVLWGGWLVITTDYTIFSLSIAEFIANYFTIIEPLMDWLYGWIFNDLLNFVLSLPLIISQSLKALISTYLGLWILKTFKKAV